MQDVGANDWEEERKSYSQQKNVHVFLQHQNLETNNPRANSHQAASSEREREINKKNED